MKSRALKVLSVGTILIGIIAAPIAGQTVTHSFNGHSFSLDLPPGFHLAGEASPMAGFKTFAFTAQPRPDGTRTLIQVSLIDLTQTRERLTVARFTRSMIDGVRRRQSQWTESESAVDIAGVAARRIEWTGCNEPSPERPPSMAPSMMRGVMITGIAGDLAFALHTQDMEPQAATTVPRGEQTLMTFAITRRQ